MTNPFTDPTSFLSADIERCESLLTKAGFTRDDRTKAWSKGIKRAKIRQPSKSRPKADWAYILTSVSDGSEGLTGWDLFPDPNEPVTAQITLCTQQEWEDAQGV